MARGLVGSFFKSPARSRLASCAWTDDDEVSPTASPISRTVGGSPRSRTVSAMKSTIRCCRGVMSDTVATLLFRGADAITGDRGTQTDVRFGLDTEHTFGQSRRMSRTRVRRRRLVAGGLLVLALSVLAPAVSGAMI